MGDNMKKRMVQTLIAVFVVSSFIVTPVLADPGDEVEALENQKSAMENQAADVQSQLVDLLVQYEALQKDIENQQVRIDQAQTDLEEAEAKEKKQYEDMKLRIKYIYEQGDSSYFESLVTATNYADLVNRAEYVQKVHNYDREQLKEYVETKEQVAELKTELEAGQADMEQMAADLSSQQTNMENELTAMRSQIADFDSQLEIAKVQAAEELQKLTEASENMVAAVTEDTGKAETVKPSSSKPSSAGTSNAGNTTKPSSGSTSKPASGTSGTGSAGNTSKPSGGTSGNGGNSGSTSSGGSAAASKPSNASLGQQIADKACEYIGNPYVYGGNSLTNGIDCSGFVQQIHALFGISTPRVSDDIQNGGKAVSYSDMLPGDVICYSGHVAIYIGNDTIVHASNSKPYPAGGIKTTSPANYRTVLAVRRYW